MGINLLLINSRIQSFWHGHTKTSRDAGTGSRGSLVDVQLFQQL